MTYWVACVSKKHDIDQKLSKSLNKMILFLINAKTKKKLIL